MWCVCVEGEGSSFSTLQGRFPGELRIVTSATNLRRIRLGFPPKCTWTGTRAGSADLGRPLLAPLATAFGQGTDRWA